ncbi:sigma-54-dependent transcriptional regulator [Oceanomicrobium pacificus]|uniref:Response regulator n=1 Tax=Oceanomicrobium pacificus TaxID=2692916 RepID=A0A6B0TXZ2_9RHOB|nr:sigma-54 dependent transcriptional regulator [Oceanomicrobium pacificus]MXU66162.1 response regulator [Oceanomicrobium pacificus]
MSGAVLLVDDEKPVRDALGQTLDLAGFDVTRAGSFIEAVDHLSRDFAGCVVTDVRMPGKDGFELLARATSTDPDLPVILLTGEGDIPMAVRAMADGAYDFLEKPCPPRRLVDVVTRANTARRLTLENRALKARLAAGDAAERLILGASPQMAALRDACRRVAASGADVLITGATGTGKDLAARVIHQLARPNQPFVAVNCGLLTADMVRRTLFGSDAGPGAFLRADGGTLFLDEVGAMPLDQQVALLHVLEERQVTDRDGRPQRLDLRVISATHEDLQALVADGRFRADLLYRLDVVRVELPRLADRPEDIAPLFRAFVEEAARRTAFDAPPLSADHVAPLLSHDWPGNVRELRNRADRFVVGLDPSGAQEGTRGLSDRLDLVERALIEEALARHGGQVSAACAELQLPRKTFYDKVKRLGIQLDRFRQRGG